MSTLNKFIFISTVFLIWVFSVAYYINIPSNPNPEQEILTASFQISGDGYSETFHYNSEDNLIFCQIFNENEMFIRIARDKNDNGENSPHIDIDLCNYSGAGNYIVIDPRERPCPEKGKRWNIFWHDGDSVYSNKGDSSPCDLTLTIEDNKLRGSFTCDNMVRFEQTELINISQGYFECIISSSR